MREDEAKAIVLDNDPGERTTEEMTSNRLDTIIIGRRRVTDRRNTTLARSANTCKKGNSFSR